MTEWFEDKAVRYHGVPRQSAELGVVPVVGGIDRWNRLSMGALLDCTESVQGQE